MAAVAPRAALGRVRARRSLYAMARYEAVKPGRLRPHINDYSSGNVDVQRDARELRAMARHLDQNHDLARGVCNVMVRNVVGPDGIALEPRPRLQDGSVDQQLAADLLGAWQEWTKTPEVTRAWSWAASCRLACRSWIRDGEMFAQMLSGRVPFLSHGTTVPFSVELLEADLVPLDYERPRERIHQGVELNSWGRKIAYWVYKQHPGEGFGALGTLFPEVKRVAADRIVHPYMTDRISQIRGVSLFASIITRLFDVKDYEESERIAAKVAASMAGYIKKGTAEDYLAYAGEDLAKAPTDRDMRMRPGMIFDDLLPGEDVGTIDSNRPSDRVTDFRATMLRAAASGADVGYSSFSRDYGGTYSAQRQELVEQWSAYAVLRDQFIAQFVRPVWEQFVFAAATASLINVPRAISMAHLTAADFRGP
ncbi:MAG: phage portal protein, partial [Salinisphaera sp.]|nr:phage portal protein [Salinisphaera sp.]